MAMRCHQMGHCWDGQGTRGRQATKQSKTQDWGQGPARLHLHGVTALGTATTTSQMQACKGRVSKGSRADEKSARKHRHICDSKTGRSPNTSVKARMKEGKGKPASPGARPGASPKNPKKHRSKEKAGKKKSEKRAGKEVTSRTRGSSLGRPALLRAARMRRLMSGSARSASVVAITMVDYSVFMVVIT